MLFLSKEIINFFFSLRKSQNNNIYQTKESPVPKHQSGNMISSPGHHMDRKLCAKLHHSVDSLLLNQFYKGKTGRKTLVNLPFFSIKGRNSYNSESETHLFLLYDFFIVKTKERLWHAWLSSCNSKIIRFLVQIDPE